MKRRHKMPFGAECRTDGGVRFRLWAPSADHVDLCIADKRNSIPLDRIHGGWFELTTDEAAAGSKYQFRINGHRMVPDPASRFQPEDVHGPSEVVDPEAFDWHDTAWRGRPWHEAVIYELHIGAFTQAGTFSAVRDRLGYLADLGITAVELMPVADFPGKRNWGYDGVFTFAPDSTYGHPDDLKKLVQSAHDHGLMILLDVVYNHFGPEGNYLGVYAPQFFTSRHRTPWGNAINFDGPDSGTVRDFFVNNALYWLDEYHFDGLRFDAVHAIFDRRSPDILSEIADTVRQRIGSDRHVHLILENDRNEARYLARDAQCRPRAFTAQWNDDIHHAMHLLLTDETDGYYTDYSERPLEHLGRCLTEGFAYQGEASAYRNGEIRGEPTTGVPITAFISFLQNHDQVGNRAFGERLVSIADRRAVRAAMAILLLAPSPPMLFMGEEFGAETPFLFFCDFEKDLASAVTSGRRNEFAHFAAFRNPADRERIPDPNSENTFQASRLEWSTNLPRHQDWLSFCHDLIAVRQKIVTPRLSAACNIKADYEVSKNHGLTVNWVFQDRSRLTLVANLGAEDLAGITPPSFPVIYATEQVSAEGLKRKRLPPWSVTWFLKS